MELNLVSPSWFKYDEKLLKAFIDADAAYKWVFNLLKAKGCDVDNPSQYFLEVAYQFIKIEATRLANVFNIKLGTIEFVDPNKKYNQENYPDPEGNTIRKEAELAGVKLNISAGREKAIKNRDALKYYVELMGKQCAFQAGIN